VIENKNKKSNGLVGAIFFVAVFAMLVFAGNVFADPANSGSYTSMAIDTGQNSSFGSITWSETTPAGTSVTMEIRTGDEVDGNGDPSGTWTSWETITKDFSFAGRYVQYKATLSSDNIDDIPTIDSVTISYQYYPYLYSLTSSPYDTTSPANIMANMLWNQDKPAGTDIKFQVATAPEDSNNLGHPGEWTEFQGPTGTDSYFTLNDGTQTMPNNFKSGSDDQFFKYKAFLSTTDGSQTPVLNDVTTKYVVNATPNFDTSSGSGVSASQISDSGNSNWGKVKIDYTIHDIDTEEGTFTPNYVTPTFQYYDGSIWHNINLANISMELAQGQDCEEDGEHTCIYDANSDGKYENRVLQPDFDGEGNVTNENYLTYTANWDAKTEVPEEYFSNFKIRVTVNDNEGANNTASADSSQTALDTKIPVAGTHPILIDASYNPARLTLDAEDDSANLKMQIALADSFNSVLTTDYSSSTTQVLPQTPDAQTVYARFQDKYGNTTTTKSATTPETPTKIMVQDTSNVLLSPTEAREFIAWKTSSMSDEDFGSYKIYRASNQNDRGEVIKTEEDKATNYYGDNDVTLGDNYYWTVVTTDNDGNVSRMPNPINGIPDGIQNAGEGGGGSSETPPIVTNVSDPPINITANSATITWDTDKASNSTVGYSTSEGIFTEQRGVNTIRTSDEDQHIVTLTNLTPNTDYYFQVTSTDSSGNTSAPNNNGGEGYHFKTLPGPEFVDEITIVPQGDRVTISWETTTDSNTIISYSESATTEDEITYNLTDPITVGNESESTKNHEYTIENLEENKLYYFLVRSTDSGDNTATDNNGGYLYRITTAPDSIAPQIDEDSIETPVIGYDIVQPSTGPRTNHPPAR
jgi:hypothetical protein